MTYLIDSANITGVHITGTPIRNLYSTFPIREDIKILPADSPNSFRTGFIMRERTTIVIGNIEGIRKWRINLKIGLNRKGNWMMVIKQ